ncbi:Hpt domain-containing protein [Aestuariicella hydrocarbonica]|uniref:Hpt domain-containing protein n=2 Tax=Pseudomaricurvus hydrocarbonicus TaxID=1470433 RepID=A0A9E5T1Q5_9GAMM|nr:Hpt domain-containing protein [Aestuariicella hydrocarbonica]NHO67006.1 Hpt domain-containing protein [Aestuariicella hydrocarbonica]
MQSAVLEEFRRCADPYVEELSVAIAGQDRSGVRALAHKLKSSCRAIGASALGDQCEVLEQLAEDGSWDKLQALELRVQLLMAKVIEAIDAVVDA